MTHEEYRPLMPMANMINKTPEQIDEMCNTGMFNEIIKGYVQMVVDGKGSIDQLLDEVTAGEARQYYRGY